MSTVENPAVTRLAGACRVGVDLTSVTEVADALAAFGDRYAHRLFTDHELASSGGRDGLSAQSLAARFAAKEAALKVLEPSGSRPRWRDIEVRRRPSGACRLHLRGGAARLAAAGGVGPMAVSLSHEGAMAVAVVVAAIGQGDRDGAPTGTGARQDRERKRGKRRMGMTTTEERTERIRRVLAAHARLPVDVAQLGDDDDLYQAGMTSHASVNVMLALEDAFDFEFPDALLRKSTFASIGSLRRVLEGLVDDGLVVDDVLVDDVLVDDVLVDDGCVAEGVPA